MGQDLVLVVDDDRDLQDMLEFVLRLGNCRVVRATTGRAGLELLRSERPSLVLLDLMLPDMRGEEFYEKLRAMSTAPPVIVISASVDVGARAARMGLPHLGKPFGIEALMELVQRSCPSAQPV